MSKFNIIVSLQDKASDKGKKGSEVKTAKQKTKIERTCKRIK